MEVDIRQRSPFEPFYAHGYPYTRHQQEMGLGDIPLSSSHYYAPARGTETCLNGCITLKGPYNDGSSRSTSAGFNSGSESGRSTARRDLPKPWLSSSSSSPPPKPHLNPSCSKVVRHKDTQASATPCEEQCKKQRERAVRIPKHATPLLFKPPHQPLQEQQQPLTKKRVRALDDVDGPGTADLPCKKRRLLLQLITSRLSRPFSIPATHILMRESRSDRGGVLRRMLASFGIGGVRRAGAGQEGALLVRKAAILNRIRIGVRKAAVLRGHAIMAEVAERRNSTPDHGLLLVTAPDPPQLASLSEVIHAQGASAAVVMPGLNGNENTVEVTVPPVWKDHTMSSSPPMPRRPHDHSGQHPQQNQCQHQSRRHSNSHDIKMIDNNPDIRHNADTDRGGRMETTHNNLTSAQEMPASRHRRNELYPTPPARPRTNASRDEVEEDDNMAFPAASFYDRYADLSDDDMDDVYADFGVLFGSRSPEVGSDGGSSPVPSVEEQSYEEYLDGLDGIPWVV